MSLTAAAIATLIATKVFETTVEKITESTIDKLKLLRQKIWDKFTGKPKAQEALTKAEQGSKEDLNLVTAYLQVEMDTDSQFGEEVQSLAQEIHQEINIGKIQGKNVQNVYGGQGFQNIDSKAPIFQGVENSPITINYNNSSD
ncbi:hypothetical protein [Anabaena subtropica]|uniref:Uncharacterized protein n=1 Tax=Anabaena subtropica FACHB-260 TaxID=2692884 RepID=A0ABR8CKS5_9NOST|nr:hypothetical protein [Anabaena subtropica]MBD2342720.1 hypothetical protein [Anabaena subtropica FACHB-260]